MAWFGATLTNDGSDLSLSLVAEPHLVADGGATGSADLPAEYKVCATYVGLESGGLSNAGDSLHVGREAGRVLVSVPMPGEAAVGLRLRLVGEARS